MFKNLSVVPYYFRSAVQWWSCAVHSSTRAGFDKDRFCVDSQHVCKILDYWRLFFPHPAEPCLSLCLVLSSTSASRFLQFTPPIWQNNFVVRKRSESGLPTLSVTVCKWRWLSSFAGTVSARIESWCGPRSSFEWLSSGFQTDQCTSTSSWCKQVKNTRRQNRSRHA